MSKSDLIDNRYRKIKTLGEGGMGTVFQVEDIARNNRVFAVKTVKKSFIAKDSDNSLQRFKIEYDIMTRLKHPNLARVFDFGQDSNGDYYILMEFVGGVTLRQLLKQKSKLSLNESLSIIIPLLRALEFIHSRNIIYRDLKPDNVLIEIDNQEIKTVKLLDFGLADLGKAEKKSKGTIHYMAPEVVAKQNIDSRADIFSLGILFYEMLTGNFIYADDSIKSVLDSLLDENTFVTTSEIRLNDINPPELKPLISQMTAYQKEHRFICCSEVIDKINLLLHKKMVLETDETEQAYVLGVDFVGRTAELQSLTASCQEQSNCLTIVAGSAGIGKSRLLEEFVKYCNLNDILFFTGTSTNSLSYEPFLEIINKLLYNLKKSELPELSGFLKLFLPDHPVLKKFKAPADSDPQTVKGVLVQLIAGMITKYAEKQPRKMAVILHNLQNVDEVSLEIIEVILNRLQESESEHKLLLITECRSEENEKTAQFFEKLKEKKSIIVLDLKPLNNQEIECYIVNMFGAKRLHSTIKDNISKIRDAVGGNPLFLQELLKMLVEKKLITRTALFWVLQKSIDQIKVPDNVREIIRQRLKKIEFSALEYRACKLLSHLHKPSLNVETLQKISAGDIDIDWNSFLTYLADNEILIEKDQEFYPVSNLVFEIIREDLSDGEACAIHRFLVWRLEDIYQVEKSNPDKLSDIELDEITFHAINAGYQTEDDVSGRTLFYLLASINRCFQRFSYKKALQFCSRVLEIEKKCSFDNTDFNKSIIEAIGLKGKILLTTNKLEEAMQTLLEAIDRYRDTTYQKEIAAIYSRLAYVCQRMSRYEEGLQYNQTAKAIHEELNDTEGLAGCSTTIALIDYYQGKYQEALASYKKSIDLIKVTDNREMLGRCYNNIGNIYWILGEYERAMKYYMRQLKISEELNNIDSIGRVSGNIGIVHNQLENYDKALFYFKKALEKSEMCGDKYNIGNTYGNMGVLYLAIGDYKKALFCHEKAYKIKSGAKDFYGIMISSTNFGDIYSKLQDFEKAEFYYSESIRLAESINAAFFFSEYNVKKAYFYFEQKRYSEAAAVLEAVKDSLHEQSEPFYKLVKTMVDCLVSEQSPEERFSTFIAAMYERIADPVNEDPSDKAEIYYFIWDILTKNGAGLQFCSEISKAKDLALQLYRELAAKSKFAEYHARLAILRSCP